MALLLTASSLFVWDIRVQGTHRLSRGEVLRALEDCGFGVGSFWPMVKTDLLRSEVMVRLPELAWMAVNVSGSRATVAVAERQPKPEMYDAADACSLVAARDSLVRRVNVLAGSAQVKEGDIVTTGQVLIAGSSDSLNGMPRAVRARGSVMADTWYELSAVCPVEERLKTPTGVPHSRFALVFGKTRLNLYIGSGKTIDGCDKIISEYTLGMPGLFSTPLRLVRERFVPYRLNPGDDYDPKAAGERLYALLEVRTEGQILESALTPGRAGELHVLTLRAHCTENIAIADG
jgi:similar to stage IV sporulation protein